MSESETKRIRRTPQQIADAIDEKIKNIGFAIVSIEGKRDAAVAEFNRKISVKKAEITSLEKKKRTLLAPKPERKPKQTKKQKIEAILKQAQKSGLSPEEIASKLGLETGND